MITRRTFTGHIVAAVAALTAGISPRKSTAAISGDDAGSIWPKEYTGNLDDARWNMTVKEAVERGHRPGIDYFDCLDVRAYLLETRDILLNGVSCRNYTFRASVKEGWLLGYERIQEFGKPVKVRLFNGEVVKKIYPGKIEVVRRTP